EKGQIAMMNHPWQSTLFAVIAWLLTLLLRKNRAAVRYWLWFAASVKFLIPFSLLLSIGSQLEWRSTPAAATPQLSLAMEISQPLLLLPEGITDRLSPVQLEAILIHELCHVRRRDNLSAAIHMAVETIFWFHPLVWWIGVRLVEEREHACDEEVLRTAREPQ